MQLKKETLHKIVGIICILLWVFIAAYFTIIGRPKMEEPIAELHLFWCVKEAWTYKNFGDWYLIIGNIFLFVPFGGILALFYKRLRSWWKISLIGFAVSLVIETSQYIFRIGWFELDDLFNNTLGTYLGYAALMILLWFIDKQGRNERKKTFVISLFAWIMLIMFFGISVLLGQPVFDWIGKINPFTDDADFVVHESIGFDGTSTDSSESDTSNATTTDSSINDNQNATITDSPINDNQNATTTDSPINDNQNATITDSPVGYNPNEIITGDMSAYTPIDYSEEIVKHDELFYAGMEHIRSCAYDYAENINQVNQLICQYFRSKRDKFATNSWNLLSGFIDYNFIALVESSDETGVLSSLLEQKYLHEPVANENIELTHFFASLNLLLAHRQAHLLEKDNSMNHTIYDMGTWAGDCIEVAEYILENNDEAYLASINEKELNDIATQALRFGGRFSRDNMLADMDAFNIIARYKLNDDIMQTINDYYVAELQDEERFELFLLNRYGDNLNYDTIYKENSKVLLAENDLYISNLRNSLGIDINNEVHRRVLLAVAHDFTEYVTAIWD